MSGGEGSGSGGFSPPLRMASSSAYPLARCTVTAFVPTARWVLHAGSDRAASADKGGRTAPHAELRLTGIAVECLGFAEPQQEGELEWHAQVQLKDVEMLDCVHSSKFERVLAVSDVPNRRRETGTRSFSPSSSLVARASLRWLTGAFSGRCERADADD